MSISHKCPECNSRRVRAECGRHGHTGDYECLDCKHVGHGGDFVDETAPPHRKPVARFIAKGPPARHYRSKGYRHGHA